MTVLLQLIVVLIVAGIIWWGLSQAPGLPQPFHWGILILLVVIVCWVLLSLVGMAPRLL